MVKDAQIISLKDKKGNFLCPFTIDSGVIMTGEKYAGKTMNEVDFATTEDINNINIPNKVSELENDRVFLSLEDVNSIFLQLRLKIEDSNIKLMLGDTELSKIKIDNIGGVEEEETNFSVNFYEQYEEMVVGANGDAEVNINYENEEISFTESLISYDAENENLTIGDE